MQQIWVQFVHFSLRAEELSIWNLPVVRVGTFIGIIHRTHVSDAQCCQLEFLPILSDEMCVNLTIFHFSADDRAKLVVGASSIACQKTAMLD